MTFRLPSNSPNVLTSRLARRPFAAALLLSAVAGGVQANQSLFSPGYGLTVGPVFNRNNLNSSGYNPANAQRLVDASESVRVGLLQAGAQYTLGDVDDLQNSLDRIDAAVTAARSAGSQVAAQAQLDIVNGLLPTLDRGGRFSVSGGGSLLTPLLIRSEKLQGVFSLQAHVQAQAAGRFLADNAVLVGPVGAPTGLSTASAFDVKAATITQLSLGYSTEVGRWFGHDGANGKLDGGLRLNRYQARLYRQLVGFTDANGNSNTGNFDRDSVSSRSASALGVDLGLNWQAENWQAGATVYNLGQPSFAYPDPTRDANAANQYAATTLAVNGRIDALDQVKLKTHLVLEGSIHTANKRWMLQTSYAANETPNFVGDLQKFVTASVSYNAERFEGSFGSLLNYLVPSIRLGWRKNMVGDRLASHGLGLSWGVVNLDVQASQAKVQADGSRVPRSAGASLSIAEKF
ncbi:conjugal transfer protein TraF [Sphaerotilus mobilis]|uniref:F plasmid transfer operon protein TraF n=1 Tax=Sphaerotilus mobilis TaxID=47994 RepID=A0A4Q7LCJ8_9BURK|nr:conjugal transfer protein TraF [Sphaerotilus mobilis]RZS47430.1 F plasmid transfer operon protein TraF [Sphaerotilus mobilis]